MTCQGCGKTIVAPADEPDPAECNACRPRPKPWQTAERLALASFLVRDHG